MDIFLRISKKQEWRYMPQNLDMLGIYLDVYIIGHNYAVYLVY